jgi:hypothetical protein
MSERMGARPDRRQHIRISPKGTVSLVSGELTRRGRIANLCQGGLLVATDAPAPAELLGSAVEVELRLDGQHAEWMQASGRIVRVASDGIAIRFERVPASLVSLIDEMSTASRASLRTLSAVLVDSDPDRRSTMAEAFRAAGCWVVESSTPLEAIVRLGESSFEPDLIVIADSEPPTISGDLRSFVTRNHPGAKLVTIGEAFADLVGDAHWLSSANPGLDLQARIRQILGRPR